MMQKIIALTPGSTKLEEFIQDCDFIKKDMGQFTDYVILAINAERNINSAWSGDPLRIMGMMEDFKYELIQKVKK